ncbi:MAG: transcription termination/antitermination protein NusA [Chloroflexi bacterium RBG_13_46_14]|nr:MAG: transcription termination/antitermination protein NusA [Chloroflexi bacterium RBG_13_46_14]
MKSDFLLAITQLSAEKNLPAEVVLSTVEAALVSAYRKDNFSPNQELSVKINPSSGKVQVWAGKTVVEKPEDTTTEITLEEARKIKPEAELGEIVMVESAPSNAGRIAAQTAKQVILQRLHEAEHTAIFEEYADREGEIVTGLVQRIEPRQILVDLGRTEAILPAAEQVPGERYRIGQRIKVSILEVVRTNKGPRVILSRSHPDLIRRLFEMEIPEIYNGTVVMESIAREAGYRSKIAVSAKQEGIDPVGCCVGLRGIRIQNIVNELNGEKIDVVTWDKDLATFIANALSPAQISHVTLNQAEGVANVVVPDRQLSLAIGKEGQNVRLAAKLTGWRIDIKSTSDMEAEKARTQETEDVSEVAIKDILEPEVVTEELETVADEGIAEGIPGILEPVLDDAEPDMEEEEEEEGEALPSLDSDLVTAPISFEPIEPGRPSLRFAEDIIGVPSRSVTKTRKKKKKGGQDRDNDEGKSRGRKSSRKIDIYESEEEF